MILQRAHDEHRIVITADLDYPRLLVLSLAVGPGLILFRGGNYSEREMESLLERVLESVTSKELTESVCVVDKHRIRITKLPVQP